jgi:hypothetical protein
MKQHIKADHGKAPRAVVINEIDSDKSSEKIAQWLLQHYPGLQVIQLATIKQNNRFYNRATFNTANGQRKVVLFDVTASHRNNMSTSVRIFPAGTMVRLWAGTESTPTRIQVFGR